MRVSAAGVGHRIRCPKCGLISRIPAGVESGGATAPGETPTERAGSDHSPDRIKFHCACGRSLNAPSTAAEKHVKCPACGAVQRVPSSGSALEDRLAADDDLLAVADALARGEAVTDYVRPASESPPRRDSLDGEFGIAPPVELPRDERIHAPVKAGPPRKCPSCGKEYPGTAKICVECGVDLKTGRALVTTQDENLDQTYAFVESTVSVVSWLLPIGLFPIASEAFGLRKPWTIRGIALATVLISFWFFFAYDWSDDPSPGALNLMLWCGNHDASAASLINEIQDDNGKSRKLTVEERAELAAILAKLKVGEFQAHQLVTHAFLHGGILHLVGNMIFLVVIGTRVNALIGNVLALVLYPLLAILSATFHIVAMQHAPPHPMVGASGAIMGLAGMYLVLMPRPKVHMVAWWRFGLITFFRLSTSIFAVPGYAVVLFYIAWDIGAVALGWTGNTAHWAHIGGFISGILIAFILLFTRLVNARGGDILNAILGKHAWALIGKPNRPGLTLW